MQNVSVNVKSAALLLANSLYNSRHFSACPLVLLVACSPRRLRSAELSVQVDIFFVEIFTWA